MSLRKIDKFQMDNSIKLALKEDITSEDVSTNAIYKDIINNKNGEIKNEKNFSFDFINFGNKFI